MLVPGPGRMTKYDKYTACPLPVHPSTTHQLSAVPDPEAQALELQTKVVREDFTITKKAPVWGLLLGESTY